MELDRADCWLRMVYQVIEEELEFQKQNGRDYCDGLERCFDASLGHRRRIYEEALTALQGRVLFAVMLCCSAVVDGDDD